MCSSWWRLCLWCHPVYLVRFLTVYPHCINNSKPIQTKFGMEAYIAGILWHAKCGLGRWKGVGIGTPESSKIGLKSQYSLTCKSIPSVCFCVPHLISRWVATGATNFNLYENRHILAVFRLAGAMMYTINLKFGMSQYLLTPNLVMVGRGVRTEAKIQELVRFAFSVIPAPPPKMNSSAVVASRRLFPCPSVLFPFPSPFIPYPPLPSFPISSLPFPFRPIPSLLLTSLFIPSFLLPFVPSSKI